MKSIIIALVGISVSGSLAVADQLPSRTASERIQKAVKEMSPLA